MKKQFCVDYNGFKICGNAVSDNKGKLNPDSIQLEKTSIILLESFYEDSRTYWDFIDGLCEKLDESNMFNNEVFSIHLIDQ
ncbi:hypothetical protein D3C73_278340 [compost metagenome]